MDLHISSEIQEYISREEYFSYALHSVLGIIENRLIAIDRPYKVEVKLETDLFDPKSEHSDITVRIKEKDYKRILDLWDDVGSSVGSFLKSLRDGQQCQKQPPIDYTILSISYLLPISGNVNPCERFFKIC